MCSSIDWPIMFVSYSDFGVSVYCGTPRALCTMTCKAIRRLRRPAAPGRTCWSVFQTLKSGKTCTVFTTQLKLLCVGCVAIFLIVCGHDAMSPSPFQSGLYHDQRNYSSLQSIKPPPSTSSYQPRVGPSPLPFSLPSLSPLLPPIQTEL